jgi:hypothetical protein
MNDSAASAASTVADAGRGGETDAPLLLPLPRTRLTL